MKLVNHKYDGEISPVYFSLAMKRSYNVFIIYFGIFILCMAAFGYPANCIPVFFWLIGTLVARYGIDHFWVRWNLLFYVIISAGWISYFIYFYGWNCGGTNFIMPLMLISMFSVYDTFFTKITFTVFLFLLRMALFFHCQTYPVIYPLSTGQMLILQVVNTVLSFVIMCVICITFSTNLQKAEKHLLLYNMELRQQAGTDPLTGLYNRRRMEEILDNHIAANPNENFCIAIGDIDLFKSVNDTYGHDCGDLVLQELSALFKDKTMGKGHVCRWGGEEFLFFFPGVNLDQSSTLINDIKMSVSYHPIVYKDTALHITMTFGVEEYDYSSDLSTLIKQADEKLYYGKTHGRDTVIF